MVWTVAPITLREIMTTNKLYVANLPPDTTEAELTEVFKGSGSIVSVSIATDRDTKAQRGFAFVEMTTEAEANKAVEECNGKPIRGNNLTVNISTPKPKLVAQS